MNEHEFFDYVSAEMEVLRILAAPKAGAEHGRAFRKQLEHLRAVYRLAPDWFSPVTVERIERYKTEHAGRSQPVRAVGIEELSRQIAEVLSTQKPEDFALVARIDEIYSPKLMLPRAQDAVGGLDISVQDFVREYGEHFLYHFTDTRNLQSIRKHGLLSLATGRERRVQIPAPGADKSSHDYDCTHGLDRYVHLCFFEQHPMEYAAKSQGRIKESIFLRVSPEVIGMEGVVLTDRLSNAHDCSVLPLAEAWQVLDLEILFRRYDTLTDVNERLKEARKYEVLVPNEIPARFMIWHG